MKVQILTPNHLHYLDHDTILLMLSILKQKNIIEFNCSKLI